jgi:hypothetical protein
MYDLKILMQKELKYPKPLSEGDKGKETEVSYAQ